MATSMATIDRVQPNPSVGAFQIAITARAAGAVRVDRHDVNGRRVHSVEPGRMPAGRHALTIDPGKLAAGMDHARLRVGTKESSVRVLRRN